MMSAPGCIVVMGVAGSGKTTIGRLLAEQLGGRFIDGDDLHPAANIRKMTRGEALTDQDRRPWLDAIAQIIAAADGTAPLVVACSALKAAYRQQLSSDKYRLVYLKGTPDLIAARLRARQGHFMPVKLLDSQFAALEEPETAIVADIAEMPGKIVSDICAMLAC